uniref:hypothetical protein n=1 Tax=Brachyspira catarrhinii TaxID=2528966 RepID=UPI003F4C159F
MKKINNFVLIIFILILSNIHVFAESGFEAIIDVPIGISITMPFGNPDFNLGSTIKVQEINGNADASAGIGVKLGYLFDIYEDIGISTLAEIGYHYNSYTTVIHIKDVSGEKLDDNITKNIRTHSIKIGLLPKFNKGNFSLGLGFGIKVPLYAIVARENLYFNIEKPDYNKSQFIEELNFTGIKDNYEIPIIPYIKLTLDYSVFFVEDIAFNIGAYFNYDFGLQTKGTDFRLDGLEFGFQLGLRFAPML